MWGVRLHGAPGHVIEATSVHVVPSQNSDRTTSRLATSHPLSMALATAASDGTIGPDAVARAVSDDDAVNQDGRRARGVRNRQAVVEAILVMLEQGKPNPTAQEIADGAGVSLRSVFRHFDDLDSLFLAAIERQAERTAHLYEPPVKRGTLAQRVASLVARRRKLYESIFAVRRGWMLRYYDHPRVSEILDEVYQGLYHQLIDLFDEDLAGLTPAVRREVLEGVDAATSFDAWAHLRSHRDLSASRSATVMRRMVLALVESSTDD